jgi:hypothetical protein
VGVDQGFDAHQTTWPHAVTVGPKADVTNASEQAVLA